MGSCYSIMGKEKKSPSSTTTWKKKSFVSSATNANADPSVLLHIPGRFSTNAATKIGCLYTQQGKKGTNQDAMLLWENFSSTTSSDTVFCGVFDGHGPYGHMVSKKVRESLPLIISTHWNPAKQCCLSDTANAPAPTTNPEDASSLSMDDESFDSLDVEETETLPDMYLPLKKSILKAFKLMDKELKLHPTIDCFCSGTTAVTVIKQGQDLVIGNVGDSRAVLATRDKDDSLLAVQLTVDLKPDLPKTKEDSRDPIFMHSDTTRNSDEIVPVPELTVENPSVTCQGQSKRSLAECISTSEDEEWSALEGITRVNSLLSLPRLLSGDKRAASWRKWV
ncbi:hypothetical protein D5086_008285 [Populus alba]|uniref:Uncharacterized protein n=1 Tax=Populus alba TaxID=43335 RepID=A0ACC4CEZ1_POPAL